MAVYGDDKDFPPGVDLIFNSNKSRAKIGDNKLDALKSVKDNLDKDPTNPFGSAIKEVGGQSFYDDPNGEYTDPITGKKQSLSLINKRSDEGDWNAWARELPSQFLSKQSMSLIKKQLNQILSISFYNARRITTTELSRLYNTSTLEKYKEAGVEEYQILAERDSRTCEECLKLDGKKFPITDLFDRPPFHPNCRCTILGVINNAVYEQREEK